MVQWTDISDYSEPDWDRLGQSVAPTLFWRPRKGATLGYIRDGELFDAKWIYVSDANKVSHFCPVEDPATDAAVGAAASGT